MEKSTFEEVIEYLVATKDIIVDTFKFLFGLIVFIFNCFVSVGTDLFSFGKKLFFGLVEFLKGILIVLAIIYVVFAIFRPAPAPIINVTTNPSQIVNIAPVLGVGSGSPQDNRPLYEEIKSHVVVIINLESELSTKGSLGTGNVIKEDDKYQWILTNRHVVEGYEKGSYVAVLENKIKYKAEVLKVSTIENVDLAVIKVEKVVGKTPLTKYGIPKIQDRVYSVGHYLGTPYTYTEGTIANILGDNILANMPSAFGCSGSGVYNEKAELIGVLYAGPGVSMFQMDTAKCILVGIEAIKTFIQEYL